MSGVVINNKNGQKKRQNETMKMLQDAETVGYSRSRKQWEMVHGGPSEQAKQ